MQPSTNDIYANDAFSVFSLKDLITVHHNRDLHYIQGSFLTEENLLFFIKEGSLVLQHGDKRYTIGENQLAFVKKGILLRYESENPNTTWLTFVVAAELVIKFTKQAQFSINLKTETTNIMIADSDESWKLYIASLQPYIREKTIAGSLRRIKLMELLFCLSMSSPSILEQLLDVRENFRADITRIVEENMLNPVSLNQLARLAGRSVSSFRRDFLSIYNMPPSRWIRLKRLEKAQQMLTATNMSVTNICYELGFESIAHFSRVFKSRFGYSPSELRVNTFVA